MFIQLYQVITEQRDTLLDKVEHQPLTAVDILVVFQTITRQLKCTERELLGEMLAAVKNLPR